MTDTVNIRLRLSRDEVAEFETIRQFLGLRSVSAVVARLALWNARILGRSLRSDSDESLDAVGEVVGEAVRLSLRKIIAESEGGKHVQG